MAGRRIVEMVQRGPAHVEDPDARGVRERDLVNGAIGGSTNAVVHLLAIAGRIGVDLTLDDWDRLGRDMPCLVNLMPSGQYLMEDFYYAGGLPVVIKRDRRTILHKNALTVNGKTLWENSKDADVLEPRGDHAARASRSSRRAASRCCAATSRPNGAVLKPSAATPQLMKHTGRAVVFEDIDDYHARIDDPELDVDENCVLVLKNCGPKGYPGMPEVGNLRAAGEDAEAGRHRHGAHLRRAHERHGLRHRRAAHRARSRGRRAAGAGARTAT